MSASTCSPECDPEEGNHEAGCLWMKAEHKYWAHHFGQDHGTREERRTRLAAMDPRNERAKAEGGAV